MLTRTRTRCANLARMATAPTPAELSGATLGVLVGQTIAMATMAPMLFLLGLGYAATAAAIYSAMGTWLIYHTTRQQPLPWAS